MYHLRKYLLPVIGVAVLSACGQSSPEYLASEDVLTLPAQGEMSDPASTTNKPILQQYVQCFRIIDESGNTGIQLNLEPDTIVNGVGYVSKFAMGEDDPTTTLLDIHGTRNGDAITVTVTRTGDQSNVSEENWQLSGQSLSTLNGVATSSDCGAVMAAYNTAKHSR